MLCREIPVPQKKYNQTLCPSCYIAELQIDDALPRTCRHCERPKGGVTRLLQFYDANIEIKDAEPEDVKSMRLFCLKHKIEEAMEMDPRILMKHKVLGKRKEYFWTLDMEREWQEGLDEGKAEEVARAERDTLRRRDKAQRDRKGRSERR